MEKFTSQQTGFDPAAFGMSACGRAFVTTIGIAGGFGTGAGVVLGARDRNVKDVTDMGHAAPAYIWGNRAWRPPSS